MKPSLIIIILAAVLLPVLALGQETVQTDRVQASVQDNGSWELTDTLTNITWHGEWVTPRLMKVTASDNSCFIISENENGMVQLNCRDLKQVSILLSYVS